MSKCLLNPPSRFNTVKDIWKLLIFSGLIMIFGLSVHYQSRHKNINRSIDSDSFTSTGCLFQYFAVLHSSRFTMELQAWSWRIGNVFAILLGFFLRISMRFPLVRLWTKIVSWSLLSHSSYFSNPIKTANASCELCLDRLQLHYHSNVTMFKYWMWLITIKSL